MADELRRLGFHELKVSDVHFAKLFERYHDLNKQINRSELRIDILVKHEEEQLRKERLVVKDQLYRILVKPK